ncbi:LSm family protein [Pedobacter gandavensis]|uniref:DUF4369 domain-containing protein n=1 Tax=Pedobacter gandavensis TaxID=2679963 RepID=A0ABR6ERS2_9SPHI|nr:hypothetical protein [Pedobacter gandavensis]MBB2147947.1 hypothetical protein [Pedobacter gandavensis]
MKIFVYLVIFFITTGFIPANAQSVKLYLAIIKAKNNISHKGILQRVDSNNVILNSENGIETIPFQLIKSIKIRVPKKSYNLKNFTPDTDKNKVYRQNAAGKFVDEWGNEEPSLTDIKDGVIASVIGNVLINSVALPVSKINPSISNFKIDYDQSRYISQLNELSYYSIYYQANPDIAAELRKLKEISLKPSN